MASILNQPHFQDPEKAREHLEAVRWPNGPVCPHCGVIDGHYKLEGKAHRPGLYKCKDCYEQFTATVGTVFERSHIKLHIWLQAVHLICSSKKGISSHQLHRTLGVTYKTAWFMSHRIREAFKAGSLITPMGGSGKIVEVDETYFGNRKGVKRARRGRSNTDKNAILALVERKGEARSFHIPSVNHENLKAVLFKQIAKDTHLMTDEATRYWNLGKEFANHSSVNHSIGEYARGDVTTNHVEGYFNIFKRGMIGTFHHVAEEHLQRYLHEFDFRYNHRETRIKVNGKWQKIGHSDTERADAALKRIGGKRLTYRRTHTPA